MRLKLALLWVWTCFLLICGLRCCSSELCPGRVTVFITSLSWRFLRICGFLGVIQSSWCQYFKQALETSRLGLCCCGFVSKKKTKRTSAVCQLNMYECTLKRYFYLQRINNKRTNLKCFSVSGSMISQHWLNIMFYSCLRCITEISACRKGLDESCRVLRVCLLAPQRVSCSSHRSAHHTSHNSSSAPGSLQDVQQPLGFCSTH